MSLDQNALDALTREVAKLNSHRFIWIQNSVWRMMLYQFLRGLSFGLGTLMGATVLVSLLAWWVSQVSFIPILGDWLVQIVEEIEKGR